MIDRDGWVVFFRRFSRRREFEIDLEEVDRLPRASRRNRAACVYAFITSLIN